MILVDATSNVAVSGLTFNCNYRNQASGNGRAIFAGGLSSDVRISDSAFTRCGQLSDIKNSVAGAIVIYDARNASIARNLFYSNWGSDVTVSASHLGNSNGAQIVNNVFGSPNVADSATVIDWWDTHAAGFRAIQVVATDDFEISGNLIYGSNRMASAPFVIGNPIIVTDANRCAITHNFVDGFAIGYGTVSVADGSTAINGTNTFFSTTATPSVYADVGSMLMIEGDSTVYQITAVASSTQVSVMPPVARTAASGLRYKIANTGDQYGLSGLRNCTVVENTSRYSHDNGFSVGMNGSNPFAFNMVRGNVAMYNWTAGLISTGTTRNNLIIENVFSNNGQGGTNATTMAGLRAGIAMDPTDALRVMSFNELAGNVLTDTQGSPTQTYGISMNPYAFSRGNAAITCNVLGPNMISGTRDFYMAPRSGHPGLKSLFLNFWRQANGTYHGGKSNQQCKHRYDSLYAG